MRKIVNLCLLGLLLIQLSCKAQHSDISCPNYRDQIELFITYEFNELKKEGFSVNDKILGKPSANGISMTDIFSKSYFGFLQKIEIKTNDDIIKFDELFDKEEYNYFKKQIECSSLEYWSEIIDNQLTASKRDTNIKSDFSFSTPIFTRTNDYIFIYIESEYSGDLRVYKKSAGKWVYYGLANIWIS